MNIWVIKIRLILSRLKEWFVQFLMNVLSITLLVLSNSILFIWWIVPRDLMVVSVKRKSFKMNKVSGPVHHAISLVWLVVFNVDPSLLLLTDISSILRLLIILILSLFQCSMMMLRSCLVFLQKNWIHWIQQILQSMKKCLRIHCLRSISLHCV